MIHEKRLTIYESDAMRQVAGDLLRPGGLFLTKRAITQTNFSKGASVLDIGCGVGATVHYLRAVCGLDAMGIDPSEALIKEGKAKYANLPLTKGRGEALPYGAASMEGIVNECTLSLMENLEKAIEEAKRVLKARGYWVITDLFARNPEGIPALEKLKVKSCIRGMFHLPELIKSLEQAGFEKCVCEDHTPLLKEMMVHMIFTYGSMAGFWSQAASPCGADNMTIDETVKKCKPGYFLLVMKKR